MTQIIILIALSKHGKLTRKEIDEITSGRRRTNNIQLKKLREKEEIKQTTKGRDGRGRWVYYEITSKGIGRLERMRMKK